MIAWMKKSFGTPSDNNHLTAADGGTNGRLFPFAVAGKKGIYGMIPNDPTIAEFDATGHVDLFILPTIAMVSASTTLKEESKTFIFGNYLNVPL